LFSLFVFILIFFAVFVAFAVAMMFNYFVGGKMVWLSVLETWVVISSFLSFLFFVVYVFKYLWPIKSHFKQWLQTEISTNIRIVDCHQKSLIFKEQYEKITARFEVKTLTNFTDKFLNTSICFFEEERILVELEKEYSNSDLCTELLKLVNIYKDRLKAEFKKSPYDDSDDYKWLLPSFLVSNDYFILEIKKCNEHIALCQEELKNL
jgi:hypothetical protein